MSDPHADAAATLAEVDRLRSQVRADRRENSAPLLILAALALLTWPLPLHAAGFLRMLPPALALLSLAAYYWRRQRALGVGTSSRSWTMAGVTVLGVFVLLPWLAILHLPPVSVAGIVVVVLGVRRRSRVLVAGGSGAALVSVLERWHVLSDGLIALAQALGTPPDTWGVANSEEIIQATLVAALIGAGLLVLYREHRCG